MTSRRQIRVIAAAALLAAAPITIAACGGDAYSGGGAASESAQEATVEGTLGAVSVQQAHDQLEKGTAVMVDVREPDELAESAVPGTIDIPLGQLEARASEIPTGKPVLVFCRSGNRSQEGAAILAAAGFDASTVEGGIIAWQDAGLPTT